MAAACSLYVVFAFVAITNVPCDIWCVDGPQSYLEIMYELFTSQQLQT